MPTGAEPLSFDDDPATRDEIAPDERPDRDSDPPPNDGDPPDVDGDPPNCASGQQNFVSGPPDPSTSAFELPPLHTAPGSMAVVEGKGIPGQIICDANTIRQWFTRPTLAGPWLPVITVRPVLDLNEHTGGEGDRKSVVEGTS